MVIWSWHSKHGGLSPNSNRLENFYSAIVHNWQTYWPILLKKIWTSLLEFPLSIELQAQIKAKRLMIGVQNANMRKLILLQIIRNSDLERSRIAITPGLSCQIRYIFVFHLRFLPIHVSCESSILTCIELIFNFSYIMSQWQIENFCNWECANVRLKKLLPSRSQIYTESDPFTFDASINMSNFAAIWCLDSGQTNL